VVCRLFVVVAIVFVFSRYQITQRSKETMESTEGCDSNDVPLYALITPSHSSRKKKREKLVSVQIPPSCTLVMHMSPIRVMKILFKKSSRRKNNSG
jgi:hypothetical protein